VNVTARTVCFVVWMCVSGSGRRERQGKRTRNGNVGDASGRASERETASHSAAQRSRARH
jgi:hypothetical protein